MNKQGQNALAEEEQELVNLSTDDHDDLEFDSPVPIRAQKRCAWLPDPVRRSTKTVYNFCRRILGLQPEGFVYEALQSETEADNEELSETITDEQNASFWSLWFFNWYNSTITLSRERPLELNDVPRLLPRHDPYIHAELLQKIWDEALQRSHDSLDLASPSLFRVLVTAYWWEFLAAFFPRLIKVVGSFVGPWVIKLIVQLIENPGQHSIWYGILLLAALALTLVVTSVALQKYWHIAMATAIHMKAGISGLLYNKLYRISAKSKASNITGKLTNLMSSDTTRLIDTVGYLHFLWATPAMMALCFISVALQIGWLPSLAGFAVFIFFGPISGFVAWRMERVRSATVQLSDARVKATNEIFSTMKTVKMYALEEHFAARANELRANELKHIRTFQVWRAAHSSITFSIVPIMSMASFVCYILLGHTFTASTAFSVMSLYYVLKWPFSLLSQVISAVVEARVSLGRLEEFLALEELPGAPVQHDVEVGEIVVENANFHWDKRSAEEPTLKNISLHCPPGTLTCIVGPVGSGKSSLLNVLLGEIEMLKGSGRCAVKGKLCYAPQVPFLIHATVRENIIFGMPFDQEKYDRTIATCCLQTDLEMLIAGDKTIIGERGINLSGGQKARISMARAVYSDADIFLLDDPLSAVDAHVGHKLFHDCIRTLLRNKTILLVTHQLQFVTLGDKLVFLQNGSILHQGTPQQLKEKGVQIDELLAKFNRGATGGDDEESTEDMDALAIPLDMEAGSSGSLSESGEIVHDSLAHSTASLRKSLSKSTELRKSLNKSSELKKSSTEKRQREQEAAANSKANVDQKEERRVGRISWDVYKFYFGHKWAWWVFAIVVVLVHRGMDVFLKIWLAEWSGSNGPAPPAVNDTPIVAPADAHIPTVKGHFTLWSAAGSIANDGFELMAWPVSALLEDSYARDASQAQSAASRLSASTVKFLWVYITGNLLMSLLQMGKETMVLWVSALTGKVVYMDMFMRLLRAPMSFFDTTPKGRIAARCSSDTDAMDNQLGGLLTGVWDNMAQILSSLVSVVLSIKYFVFAILPISIGYVNLYNRFINGYRELARLQGIAKAPLFSQFGETLNGLYTLRAYDTHDRMLQKLYSKLDASQRTYFFGFVSARWLGVRMDILGAFLICGVASVALFNTTIDPGLMGMALSYCLLNTELLNGLIRGLSDIESRMNSVERIEQYTHIEVERAPIIPSKRPPENWPSKGIITFEKVCLRYREGLPLVLNNLSFNVRTCEKVGIVGRTGAGKSSMLTALLSLAPLSGGRVLIDGIDINEIGVDDLRSRISIIPQDPCIFDGNVRHNIDPFGKYSDVQIWDVLRKVHLADAIDALPGKLDSELADEGANFSLGQRQLLCVGRALLRDSKILLLDEASSSIDLETDRLLQETLRREFANCTTITIAHRLATIMDSDRVLVMEAGQLKEFDSPARLLADTNSTFYSLHQQAQASSAH